MLKASTGQIATDTPMTAVAVTRIKKLTPKVARESGGAMRKLIVDVAGKTAAEMLKGGGSGGWGSSTVLPGTVVNIERMTPLVSRLTAVVSCAP